ncbi:Hsp70 family protein [Amnibacterium sp.]|uniref:Hsp70 family protein n=1 Tax=Amnibacterium sp. TaxID=1872496 RepID=UPI00262FD598|nr:Hsp70 family protein [Amnibacterium sp.]
MTSAKPFIGRTFDEVSEEASAVGFGVVPSPGGEARFDIRGKLLAPEEISALVLRKLAARVRRPAGRPAGGQSAESPQAGHSFPLQPTPVMTTSAIFRGSRNCPTPHSTPGRVRALLRRLARRPVGSRFGTLHRSDGVLNCDPTVTAPREREAADGRARSGQPCALRRGRRR